MENQKSKSDIYREQYLHNKKNPLWVEKRKLWSRTCYQRKIGVLPPYVKRNIWGGACGKLRRQRHTFKYLVSSVNALYKDNKIKASDLSYLYRQQNGLCALTGEKLTRDNMSVDHIVSRANGGMNIVSNIRLTVKDANIMRNTMSDQRLYELCSQIVIMLSPMYTVGTTPTQLNSRG